MSAERPAAWRQNTVYLYRLLRDAVSLWRKTKR